MIDDDFGNWTKQQARRWYGERESKREETREEKGSASERERREIREDEGRF
jgi:hypothetical protein